MCGIHLLLNPPESGEIRIKSMLHQSHHRGPDQSGFEKLAENGWLGANRLKILDLSDTASMPMRSEDGRLLLAWNGAIYNYIDLREKLALDGYRLKTSSDTEVLLYWLKANGERGLADLHGMYSLILVDLEKQQILIARDPTGQKPLYYFRKNAFWAFSSEVRAVELGTGEKLPIDQRQFLPYLHYRFCWPDSSLIQGIAQVLPGESMVLDFSGNVLKKTKSESQTLKKSDSSDWEMLLKKSVLSCAKADRPSGMVLSGGIDSSLMYALWYEQTGTRLPTFTAHFGKAYEKEFCDLTFAKKLGAKYPSCHEEIEISKKIVMENWDAYAQSMDLPVGDGAGFLTWYIGKRIGDQVKVLLSGAGADELFGGYTRHWAFSQYLKNPGMTSLTGKALGLLGLNAARKFSSSIEEDPINTFIQMAALHPIPKNLIGEFVKYFPKEDGNLKSALAFDRQFYLVNDILKIHDSACMAHGIEGRAPYLDRELIAWASSLTESEVNKNIGKKNLKQALEHRGLQEISHRPKLGFGMPIRKWLQEEDFRDFVFSPIQWLEKHRGNHFSSEIRTLMQHPEDLVNTNFQLIWNWFVLASWLQNREK